MAKTKRFDCECEYALCPLGKGFPLCSYKVVTERRHEARLQDFPMCDKSMCPKKIGAADEQEE